MSFQGFEESEVTNPRESTSQNTSTSNSDASDYETTGTQATPTSSPYTTKVNTVQRKRSDRTSVQQLIEHFSSDSDTAADLNRVTSRRRRSITVEHVELPPGGEKQIKKKMADQKKAEYLVNLYKVMAQEFVTSMNEAETDQDAENLIRDLMLGHLASLTAQFEDVETYWKKIEDTNDKPGVNIEFGVLLLARNKNKARFSKIKARILATTDKTPAEAPGTVRIINPTSFGDILLPKFKGDYVEFDNFEATFRNLINNGNLDEGGKLAYLMHNLQGEAKEFIGRDGLAEKTYEDVWTELRSRYGKPWRITRAAVKGIIDIRDPQDTPQDITRYWNQINEACKVAERIKLSATSIILNMALLKLPTEFRSKMDDKLKAVSDKYILTRSQVAEPFNDIIAGELDKPSSVVSTLSFNTTTTTGPNKNSRAGGRNNKPYINRGGPGGHPLYCMMCSKKGDHKSHACPIYTSGPAVQNRLRELGRCMRCAVPFGEHGPECSHRVSCKAHPGERHLFFACMNYKNYHHVTPPSRPLAQNPRPIHPGGQASSSNA